MPAKLLDLRFGVKRPDGHISNVWKIWTTRNRDVYLATRGLTSIAKYSLHASGVCRKAFTQERGTPSTMTDRKMFGWRRAEVPPVGGLGASLALQINFATDFLSRPVKAQDKPVCWIEAAPSGGATCVEFCFTRASEETVRKAFGEGGSGRRLLCYVMLPAGEAFFMSYYHADAADERSFTVTGEGKVNDLVFSAQAPVDTGRPIRICINGPPKDGDALEVWEFGGYAVPPMLGQSIVEMLGKPT
jgi:hypothetical protein